MMATDEREKWRAWNEKVLAAVNIEDEYKRFNVRIAGRQASPSGWLACHALGREDKNASAAINVSAGPLRGRYRDLGGGGDSLSFFQFAALYGSFADWRAARDHFAKQAGLSKHSPRGDDSRRSDSLDFLRPQPEGFLLKTIVKGFLNAYPGITVEGLTLCGARIARYPRRSVNSRLVIVLPCYGPNLFDDDPNGYVVQAADGSPIMLYKGPDAPPEPTKRFTMDGTGLLGRHGLSILDKAERIVKVEGFSDLLVAQSQVPPSHIDKVAVITNAGGATEVWLPGQVAHLFGDKDVWIVHDADKAGEDGSALWTTALTPAGARVRQVKLPYPVVEKHGKDLRNWYRKD